MLLGLALFRWVAILGQSGRFIGFVVALLYFGLLNSRLHSGQTIGKRLLGIRVTDRAGQLLSPPYSITRFLVLAIPYFLNGLWFDVDAASAGWIEYFLGALLVFVVFGGLGSIVYLFVFNRRTRQSLHDLAVRSFVVHDRPVAMPPGLVTPRLHLIIVGCWLVLTLIGPAIGIWAMRGSSLAEQEKPLGELQAAIKTQLGVQQVKATMGSTTTTGMREGTSTTSYLQVEAQPGEWNQDLDTLLLAIAGKVLDLHPDLLGNKVLIVQVQRRFDLGIASWSEGQREALDAVAWREKLAQFHAHLNRI